MIQQYLMLKQLVLVFQISKDTAYKWIARGCPRYCINPDSINPEWRYNVDEIAAWLKANNPDKKGGSNDD